MSCVATAQTPTPQTTAPAAHPAEVGRSGGITENELRQFLVGKTFYLRGGYLDDSLSFNEHGGIIGHSQQGSYTLSLIEIDKVRLTRHKVELEGVRYGLHFLGALPYEDPASAFDRVRITPPKKFVRISIDRELVVKPKKEKGKKAARKTAAAGAKASDLQAAAAPVDERPSDADSVTAGSVATTTSPAHAAQTLKDALANIFAPELDARMIAAMPQFWKLYYRAVTAKTDYRPSDPAVLGQSTVDRKARLLSSFEPESNEYAQRAGVAGMALYHVVVGADGAPREIALARPIGFGLDENAVAAIRKARFDPALKDGKPAPVLLDLVVEFRIYSKRTAQKDPTPAAGPKSSAPSLPGPYSIPHPQ